MTKIASKKSVKSKKENAVTEKKEVKITTSENNQKNAKDKIESAKSINKDSKDASKDLKTDKNNDKTTIIALVIFLLVVGGIVAGLMIDRNTKKTAIINEYVRPYNGYEFNKDANGHWITIMHTVSGDKKIPFYYHPEELLDLEYDSKINEMLSIVHRNGGTFTVAYGAELTNPDIPGTGMPAIAGLELSKMALYVFGMQTSAGFTDEIENTTFNVVSCDNASLRNYVVEMRLGDENKLYSKDYCAVMEVKTLNDTIRLADLFAYKITGVINT